MRLYCRPILLVLNILVFQHAQQTSSNWIINTLLHVQWIDYGLYLNGLNWYSSLCLLISFKLGEENSTYSDEITDWLTKQRQLLMNKNNQDLLDLAFSTFNYLPNILKTLTSVWAGVNFISLFDHDDILHSIEIKLLQILLMSIKSYQIPC